ncbi:hypothetical protein [Planctomicrobium piriforme]|uniref:Uncharacterized protein n=1 Tax=Planctomicrobium piriforme TaxID=1576369 RepID=A0A1I3GZX0_9PLAN|nr:hypothetical protein [Planctomicrobium piriforme]SFI28840.1 hypothetical protein SAMN05421753_107191 [Planctomicrobium piriforme]
MPQTPKDQDLEEEFFQTNAARIQHWIPWLRLFRGFRMAIDYRRIFLALLAVILWSGGLWAVNFWLGTSPDNGGRVPNWPWSLQAGPNSVNKLGRVDLIKVVTNPWESLAAAVSNGRAILWPVQQVLLPAQGILFTPNVESSRLTAWIVTLWGLFICSLFGGAIARMAAVDFAGKGELTVMQSLRFSARHLISYLGAPLIPLVGLAVCWIPNLIAGLLTWVPVLGDGAVGALWILPVISGTLMALIVAGVASGWPLMLAAISTEASDAFDGLSRAYSYLFNQLLYAIFLAIVVLIYGSAGLFLVTGMMTLSVDLTVASVESGAGSMEQLGLLNDAPPNPAWDQYRVVPAPRASAPAKTMAGMWMAVVGSVPIAFIFSFFWTSITLIYFLLRLRDDATPLTEVAGAVPGNGPTLPVVGMPAAERRELQIQSGEEPPAERE